MWLTKQLLAQVYLPTFLKITFISIKVKRGVGGVNKQNTKRKSLTALD